MKYQVSGILPATATPFDKDGRFNRDALIRLLEWNLSEGADGFFLGGSSAECFLLTEEERISIFEAASVFLSKTELIAHVGAISTGEAVRYAKEAKRMGYHYLAATPPYYYSFTAGQIADYYYDISRAADLPVLVYSFPGNTGKTFDLANPLIVEMFRSEAIFATKHTSMDLLQLERLRELCPDLVILNGYEETVLPALSLGADGAILASGNFAVRYFRKLYEAFQASDIITAKALQHKANHMMSVMYKNSLTASVKHSVGRFGIDIGLPRKPFTPLTAGEAAKLDIAVDACLKD